MDNPHATLTFREYPLVSWIIGLGLIGSGVFFYFQNQGALFFSLIEIGIGLLALLLGKVLTVTADKVGQTLTLRYRGLLPGSEKVIPLSNIAAIQLARNHDSDGSSTYRIEVICKDNQAIPFHSYYSSGIAGKQKKIDQLRAFLEVGGQDQTSFKSFGAALQAVQETFTERQATVTGTPTAEQVTDGVHWTVQTVGAGSTTVTRWFSPDYKFPGGFLLLAQKVAGQKTMAGGLMGGVGKFLFQQAARLYGFGAEDTPGMETADLLAPLGANLEAHFSAFTSDATAARQVLNPWTESPLEGWATRYPLKQVQAQGPFGQLAVLYSPRGVYAVSLGTMFPEAVEEMTNLGVALVKAQ